MQVTIDVLNEVQNHLQSMVERFADFEYESQEHKDYLDTVALLAKVRVLREYLGDRS